MIINPKFITDKQMSLLEKDLNCVLSLAKTYEKGQEMHKDFDRLRFSYPQNLENELAHIHLFLMGMAKSTYSHSIERGSASNPIYNSNWSVGIFGSVWCDMLIEGQKYRFHLITKNNCPRLGVDAKTIGNNLLVHIEKS